MKHNLSKNKKYSASKLVKIFLLISTVYFLLTTLIFIKFNFVENSFNNRIEIVIDWFELLVGGFFASSTMALLIEIINSSNKKKRRYFFLNNINVLIENIFAEENRNMINIIAMVNKEVKINQMEMRIDQLMDLCIDTVNNLKDYRYIQYYRNNVLNKEITGKYDNYLYCCANYYSKLLDEFQKINNTKEWYIDNNYIEEKYFVQINHIINGLDSLIYNLNNKNIENINECKAIVLNDIKNFKINFDKKENLLNERMTSYI